jgi:hypothetical protein
MSRLLQDQFMCDVCTLDPFDAQPYMYVIPQKNSCTWDEFDSAKDKELYSTLIVYKLIHVLR